MKVVVVMMVLAIVAGVSSAATHIVGDRTGWTVPTSASFYTNWAAKQKFQAGDVLVFNFPAGAHTVGEVSKSAYDSCATTSTLSAVKTTAPANHTLKSGTHYFICTIPGHCTNGQKLAVTVGAGSTSAAPASAPAAEQPSAAGPATAGETIPAVEGPAAGAAGGPFGAISPPGSNGGPSTVAAGASILSFMGLAVVALF